MRITAIVAAVALLTPQVFGGGWCGYDYGYSYNYCKPQKVEKRVVEKAVPQNVSNLSITNVFPQGSTQYTSSQASSLYATNPSLAIEHSSRVATDAITSLKAAIGMGQSGNRDVAEVAKIQAATEHLRSATQQGQRGQRSVTLRIIQSGSGIDVERLDDGGDRPQRPGDGNGPPPPPPRGSVLEEKCGRCHGTQLDAPKGGLYLGPGVDVPGDTAMRALDIVRGNNVPKPMQEVVDGLSNEDKAAIMDELLELWKG